MPVENGRFQQTCRSTPSVVQQFVKYCHAACVRGEPCVGVADGAVGLSFVIPNGTLRPRHELPLLFPELNLLTWRALKGTADVRCGTDAPRPEVATCPLFSPELDNGEEHCKIIVRHGQGIRKSHPCPNAAPQTSAPQMPLPKLRNPRGRVRARKVSFLSEAIGHGLFPDLPFQQYGFPCPGIALQCLEVGIGTAQKSLTTKVFTSDRSFTLRSLIGVP
jgi:hypothetical protein